MNLLPERIQDQWNEVAYSLRQNLSSHLKLRAGLPVPQEDTRTEGECEFYRIALARAWSQSARDTPSRVWDIGCRNWSYARALAEMFPQARELVGVEVDGGRRYWNLYRRMDVAAAHAASLVESGRQARCVFDDFRNVPVPASSDPQAFCFFFPFVSKDPCLGWGLPSRFADFESLLAPIGEIRPAMILSAHQGEWEAELARAIYGRIGWRMTESVIRAEELRGLWPSPYDVHVFSCELS